MGKPMTNKRGRPSKYSDEIVQEICTRLAVGESLNSICKDTNLPSIGTVMRWLYQNDNFREKYEYFRKIGLEYHADQMLDIADDGTNDWMERLDKDGNVAGYVVNGEHVQRSRLRLDTRKWLLSKLLPKKYGDTLTLTGDPENPLQTKTEVTHTFDDLRVAMQKVLGNGN